jgi:hypothetical protein
MPALGESYSDVILALAKGGVGSAVVGTGVGGGARRSVGGKLLQKPSLLLHTPIVENYPVAIAGYPNRTEVTA